MIWATKHVDSTSFFSWIYNLQKVCPPPQVKWQNDKAGEDCTDVENEVEEFEKQAVTYVVSA